MSRKIFELPSVVAAHRPLGALSMTLSLGAAWVGTTDKRVREDIEGTIADFQRDLHGSKAAFAEEDWTWCRKQFSLT